MAYEYEENNDSRNIRGKSNRRFQSSFSGVKGIKRNAEKEISGEIGKEIWGKKRKGMNMITNSKPIEKLNKEVGRRIEVAGKVEEEKREEANDLNKNRTEEILNEQMRARRDIKRQEKAFEYRKNAKKEAEKEVNKKLKEIGQGYVKRKVVSKVAGRTISNMAYEISQKMADRANKGGLNSIIIIQITLFLAIFIDTVDILMQIGLAAAIVSAIGAIPGAIIGFLIWAFNLFLSMIIVFFWMIVLGGGHKKWFWKLLMRLFFFVVLAEAIPIVDLAPWTVVVVCWNWYDFAKEKARMKKELHKFQAEFQATGKINKKYASYL